MTEFILYPHQQLASEFLLRGTNVILQAPTGSGKTLAALLPWMNKRSYTRDFPRKCIYTVPMRVLATQFVDEFSHLGATIQTGEDSRDPYFASDLIFTTIDQALSRFLNYPYGLSKRKANMSAAAVMSAYLVFDEFHLLDPKSTLPTTLAMLKLLKGVVPFMLMTATFSQTMLGELAAVLDAEVIPSTPDEQQALLNLPSQQKTRHYTVSDVPLTAKQVLDAHTGRSIVICNTVDRARAMFDDLRQLSPDTEVILLHSRFLPADRKAAQDQLIARFGKNADHMAGSVIAVATQAIEVGVDITCEALHTELAPANAIIQRAGRCARYAGETGRVTIYRQSMDIGEVIDLTERVNPYAKQETVMRQTWEAFSARDGQIFTFADEQTVLSEVHGSDDRIVIDQLKSGEFEHKRQMFDVMAGRDNLSNPASLIRDVFQTRVTISDDPDSLKEAPFEAESFGLHPGSLQKYFAQWQTLDGDHPFRMKYLVAVDGEKSQDDASTYRRTEYKWEPVRTGNEIFGAGLLVIHPALASYDSERGLVLGQAGTWQASLPPKAVEAERKQYTYKLETYERHIALVYDAAFGSHGAWEEVAGLAARLEQRFGWAKGDVRKATVLAVLLHDVGKLSRDWQTWVKKYQAAIDEPTIAGEAYAHTESQTAHHRATERTIKPARPTHAVESAMATSPIYTAAFPEDHPLVYAIYSAIARHHSPFADSNEQYTLIAGSNGHVRATLTHEARAWLGEDWELITEAGRDADPQRNNIAKPEDGAAYWAYLLIARVLRQADQTGTERGSL